MISSAFHRLDHLLDLMDRLFLIMANGCLAATVIANAVNILWRGILDEAIVLVWPWSMMLFVWAAFLGFFVLYRRKKDVVVLVLSKSSVNSDWVKHELKVARRKEKEEGRDVLCPVTLDDAWHARKDDLLWERLTESLILDFSKWKTKAFDAPFGKLIKGLRTNFPRDDPDAPASAPKAES